MYFEVIGKLERIELIVSGKALRDSERLEKLYGQGKWRKLKGTALVKLKNGRVRQAELHWYEAHGIGKKEIKCKRYLD